MEKEKAKNTIFKKIIKNHENNDQGAESPQKIAYLNMLTDGQAELA